MSHPVWVRGLKPNKGTTYTKHLQSHPVWVRGLKQLFRKNQRKSGRVAPRVGAWIETASLILLQTKYYVAPRVGAWIETTKKITCFSLYFVAPRVGAWIETRFSFAFVSRVLRRTPCGCVD
mgnify:CR=1 FL=1